MLDIGWSEIVLIGAVAIVVIGPKELPQVMKHLARGLRAAKRTMREFQRQMDDIVHAEEIKDIRKDIEHYGIHNIPEQIEREIKRSAEFNLPNPDSKDEPK